MGEEEYRKNHGKFISEVRADIFSIIDFGIQTNSLFKGAFSQELLGRTNGTDASRIIEFYTLKTEANLKITSPIQKFITFYNQNSKAKITKQEFADQDIMSNLLLGNDIPYEVLIEINKIATGKVVTTDIYGEILNIISKYETNDLTTVKSTTK